MARLLSSLPRQRQQGAVLVVGLLFLVMLTLIGVTAMSTGMMDERMAGNSRDLNLAFQAAEAALRDGELYIQKSISPASGFSGTCANGLCQVPTVSTPWYKTIDWSSSSVTRTYGTGTSATALPAVASQPKYIIESIGQPGAVAGTSIALGLKPSSTGNAYRVSARGVGGRAGTQVLVQSIYVKR